MVSQIIIGSVLLVLLGVITFVFFYNKRKRQESREVVEMRINIPSLSFSPNLNSYSSVKLGLTKSSEEAKQDDLFKTNKCHVAVCERENRHCGRRGGLLSRVDGARRG